MSARPRTIWTAALLCCLAALPAVAQNSPPARAAAAPANLAYVEGAVDVIHEGVADRAVAQSILVDGDIVRTLNGRAEMIFADGSLLHADARTEIEVLGPTRLRLVDGRVMLRVSAAATAPYVIDTQASSVRLEPRGEYGLLANARVSKLEVTVARGAAELDDAGSRAVVGGGEMGTILGAGGRVLRQAFNSARWDEFARWSNDRTNGFATAASARRLPPELRPYGPAFDSYGRWDDVEPYGTVWFPAVATTWRPYHSGGWSLTRYGWTWVGTDPWAWPTHHFGRWGFTGASWYWIPNNVWGPAWVSWVFVPGYVSWSPLGWNGRAAIGFSSHPNDHPAYWPDYDPWRSWTVVPRDSFGGRRHVRVNALDPATLPDETRRVMASQNAPVDVAVPRDNVAVPRESVEMRRRGGVRSRDPVRYAPPAASAPQPAYSQPTYPQPTDPEPTYTVPQPTYTVPQPTYTVPQPSAIERRAEPRPRGREQDAPMYVPPQEWSRPQQRDASPARGRDRDPQAAQPRTQEQPRDASAPPPPPRGESRGETRGGSRAEPRGGSRPEPRGEGRVSSPGVVVNDPVTGGARRRPPQ